MNKDDTLNKFKITIGSYLYLLQVYNVQVYIITSYSISAEFTLNNIYNLTSLPSSIMLLQI